MYRKKLSKLHALVIFSIIASMLNVAHAADSPVSLAIESDNNQEYLDISSTVDAITINDVILNRGNCRTFVIGRLSATGFWENPESGRIRRGDRLRLLLKQGSAGCDLVEVELRTSLGEFTYSVQ